MGSRQLRKGSTGRALVVGGSIVIPHLRRAVDTLDTLNARETPRPDAETAR